ncbi:MAG: hypothetical protein ABI614_29570 [Planctomycetota bacterium]
MNIRKRNHRVPLTISWTLGLLGVLSTGFPFLETLCPGTVARGQENGSPTASSDDDHTGLDVPPETTRPPVSRDDLNRALTIFDELNEQIHIAAAKLDGQSLARKEEIGKLRSLLSATDEQIQLQSTALGRLEERYQHLQQDLAGASSATGDVAPQARTLLAQSRAPIDSAKARLERLANFRVRTRQRLDTLQQEHVQALLAVIVSAEPTSHSSDFEQLLESSLQAATP